MRRSTLPLALVLGAMLLAPRAAAAQPDLPRVYSMDFDVDFADVPMWIEYFQRYDVPTMDALVDEGVVLAYDLWVHDTGGEHTLRYSYVLPNFAAVAEVGANYMQRMEPAQAAAFEALQSTTHEMTDGIWYLRDSNIPDGRSPSPYVYEASFQVEPAGIEKWNADFAAYIRPGLERAMEEGLISAWAKLDHSIGGPWNSRYVYWVTSWDAIDDLNRMLSETAQELGATMEGTASVRRHTDAIWTPAPRSGGM